MGTEILCSQRAQSKLITGTFMDFSFKGLSAEKALTLEWLDVNELGGYASSTIINCHTRKYHGLLAVNLDSAAEKYILLSQMEETLSFNKKDYLFSVAQYPGLFQQEGFFSFQEFKLTTHPTFIYQMGDAILIKEILMPQYENTVLIKYTLKKWKNATLKIRPLVAGRNFHSLVKENNSIQTQVTDCKNGKKFTPYSGIPSLYFQLDRAHQFYNTPLWYRHFEYVKEKERGFDDQEDLFTPGWFSLTLQEGDELIFSCSIKELSDDLSHRWKKEMNRRLKLQKNISAHTDFQHQLKTIARSFILKNPENASHSIIAGYHWFGEWGRDAMISLPGLTLYSGLENICLEVLKKFSQHERDGLIPNYLGQTPDKNAYNSVDASLWFAFAVQHYFLKTHDQTSIKKYCWNTLKNIFSNYKNGTSSHIKMAETGLLLAGSKTTNLTWMDAMVNGRPATPRHGAIVEINALWFNFLNFMLQLAPLFNETALCAEITPLIRKVKKSFCDTFWDEKLGFLKDFVSTDEESTAIRPNQIFAVSMPYSPLTTLMAKKVVAVVEKHLLTPYGLRTLSPEDPGYIGIYAGNSASRDQAYHNGTVWPWLLCHFGEALLKTTGKQNTLNVLNPCLNALEKHVSEAGIGSISEIFSGDAPHHPDGCISQAWSVAEILRLTCLLYC